VNVVRSTRVLPYSEGRCEPSECCKGIAIRSFERVGRVCSVLYLVNTTLWFTYRHQRPHEPSTRNNEPEDAFTRLRIVKRLKTSHRQSSSTTVIDHFERYITSDPLLAPKDEKHQFDVIGYWLKRRQGEPELAQFAFDVLSIPVMYNNRPP